MALELVMQQFLKTVTNDLLCLCISVSLGFTANTFLEFGIFIMWYSSINVMMLSGTLGSF